MEAEEDSDDVQNLIKENIEISDDEEMAVEDQEEEGELEEDKESEDEEMEIQADEPSSVAPVKSKGIGKRVEEEI